MSQLDMETEWLWRIENEISLTSPGTPEHAVSVLAGEIAQDMPGAQSNFDWEAKHEIYVTQFMLWKAKGGQKPRLPVGTYPSGS